MEEIQNAEIFYKNSQTSISSARTDIVELPNFYCIQYGRR